MTMPRAALFALLAAIAPAAGALEEVPFVTTPEHVALAMLEIAKVGPRDFLIDLGSGDGRIVILAARRFGTRGLGVEIDPQLVERSRAAAERAGVSDRAHFREQDLFKTDLTPASVITMYLLPDVNLELRARLLKLRPGTRVVSHDWDMGDWAPDKTITLPVPDKPLGREKVSHVHLWIVPARVDGAWCGLGKARGARLEITQAFQKFTAKVSRETTESFEGSIEGSVLHTKAGVRFDFDGAQIRNTHASGKLAFIHGAKFRPARGASCK